MASTAAPSPPLFFRQVILSIDLSRWQLPAPSCFCNHHKRTSLKRQGDSERERPEEVHSPVAHAPARLSDNPDTRITDPVFIRHLTPPANTLPKSRRSLSVNGWQQTPSVISYSTLLLRSRYRPCATFTFSVAVLDLQHAIGFDRHNASSSSIFQIEHRHLKILGPDRTRIDVFERADNPSCRPAPVKSGPIFRADSEQFCDMLNNAS